MLPSVIARQTRPFRSVAGSALRVQEENRQLVSVDPSKGASEIEEKKRLLQKAVEAQDFEQAAVLRDQIKELESHE